MIAFLVRLLFISSLIFCCVVCRPMEESLSLQEQDAVSTTTKKPLDPIAAMYKNKHFVQLLERIESQNGRVNPNKIRSLYIVRGLWL